MTITLLEFEDSNMAGYVWKWSFFLNRTANGCYTVSCQQTVYKEGARRIPARRGLRDAVEIYDALCCLIDEAGYSLDDHFEQIVDAIRPLDRKLADDFVAAPAELEKRDEAAHVQNQLDRYEKLKPVHEIINAYVMRFDDERFRNYGGSRRTWTRKFIEDYFIANGVLPTGKHVVKVAGYTGGEHDFTDLLPK